MRLETLMYALNPIGHVRSCYPDKFGTPRQPGLVKEARAFLKLTAQVQPEFSLLGLDEFSHLWVIFLFHKNNSARFHAKVHPPRLGGKTLGVFASRSPHRPNPIGLSLVEIVSVENDGIWVSGVDLIEGTPILDIKPYLVHVESQPLARSGWSEHLANNPFEIAWSDQSKIFINDWVKSDSVQRNQPTNTKVSLDEITQLIECTLKLDPRPLVYRGYEGEDSPYRDQHAVRIYNLDVHFRFLQTNRILISRVSEFSADSKVCPADGSGGGNT